MRPHLSVSMLTSNGFGVHVNLGIAVRNERQVHYVAHGLEGGEKIIGDEGLAAGAECLGAREDRNGRGGGGGGGDA